MKKLLFLLAVLILAAGIAFAQEYDFDQNGNGVLYGSSSEPAPAQQEEPKKERAIELFDWEFSVAYPVHWSNGVHGNDPSYHPFYPNPTHDVIPDKTVTANTAIGTSMTFNFTKKIGLTFDFDISYSTKLTGQGTSQSDSVSMFGMNVFLGPQFYIVNNDKLRIPIAVGAHMYYYSDQIWMAGLLHSIGDGAWVKRTDLQIGPGIMFGVQFHFDNNIYMFSRTSVYIDIIRIHNVEGRLDDGSGSGTISNWAEFPGTDILDVHWSIKPAIGIGIKF